MKVGKKNRKLEFYGTRKKRKNYHDTVEHPKTHVFWGSNHVLWFNKLQQEKNVTFI